jgi:hypothetical protein
MVQFVRLVLFGLVAMALAAPQSPFVAALGAILPHHAPVLPHHHGRVPTVVKLRMDLPASARLAARNAPEPNSRAAKHSASPSSCLSTSGHSPGNPGLYRVFRPLRC